MEEIFEKGNSMPEKEKTERTEWSEEAFSVHTVYNPDTNGFDIYLPLRLDLIRRPLELERIKFMYAPSDVEYLPYIPAEQYVRLVREGYLYNLPGMKDLTSDFYDYWDGRDTDHGGKEPPQKTVHELLAMSHSELGKFFRMRLNGVAMMESLPKAVAEHEYVSNSYADTLLFALQYASDYPGPPPRDDGQGSATEAAASKDQ